MLTDSFRYKSVEFIENFIKIVSSKARDTWEIIGQSLIQVFVKRVAVKFWFVAIIAKWFFSFFMGRHITYLAVKRVVVANDLRLYYSGFKTMLNVIR